MKRIATLGIAIVMAAGLMIPAFADIDISGIITVDWYDNERDANILDFGNEAGQSDNGFRNSSSSLTSSGEPMTFDLTTLELDVEADVTENISVRTDLEFEGGSGSSNGVAQGTALHVEQAYVKIAEIFDWPVDVVIGKFNAPWGVEPEERADLKLITYSLVTTFTDIKQLTGLAVSGGVSFIDYVVYVANGVSPRLTTDTDPSGVNAGNALTAAAGAAASGIAPAAGPYGVDIDLNDNDNNLALGFRIGVAPEFIEGFEAGAGFVISAVDPDRQYLSDRITNGALYYRSVDSLLEAVPTEENQDLLNSSAFEEQLLQWDIDAIYQTGPFEFRGEYVNGRVNAANGFAKLNYVGFSFEGSYDITDRLGVIARYATYDQNQNSPRSQGREAISVGANYKVADNVRTKIEYTLRSEDDDLSSGIGRGVGNAEIDAKNTRIQGRDGATGGASIADMYAEDKNHFIGAELAVQF